MDSGFDAGGESVLETQIAELRATLHERREAAEVAFDERRHAREDRGHDDVTARGAIEEYEKAAEELLSLAPDDPDATAALDRATQLRGALRE